MAGEDTPKLYCTDEDRDADWNGATGDPAVVEDAWRHWQAESGNDCDALQLAEPCGEMQTATALAITTRGVLMTSLSTCLILTGQAKEAADFYCHVFGTEITQAVPDGQGGVMLCTFALAGHDVVVLNGTGPEADIQSQRVTLQVHVDGQEEFDHYWYALLDGGQASKNGWLVDKFGIWWDIVPIQQMQIFSSASPEAMQRLAATAKSMERIDIAELERAAAGN